MGRGSGSRLVFFALPARCPPRSPRGVYILGHRFFHGRAEATRKTIFEVLFHGGSLKNLAKAQRAYQFPKLWRSCGSRGIGANQAEAGGENLYLHGPTPRGRGTRLWTCPFHTVALNGGDFSCGCSGSACQDILLDDGLGEMVFGNSERHRTHKRAHLRQHHRTCRVAAEAGVGETEDFLSDHARVSPLSPCNRLPQGHDWP